MIKSNFNKYLERRLNWAQGYAHYLGFYLENIEINEKISKEFYKNKIFILLALKIYFLPTNILKYFHQIKARHSYYKTLKEIEILKIELRKNNSILCLTDTEKKLD